MSLLTSFFGTKAIAKTGAEASPIDVIQYVASLAATPRSIDPILDDLRELTARLPGNKPFGEQDQGALARIYHRLETYLVEQESVQVFTKDGLKQRIVKKFAPNKTTNGVFWGSLGI